MLGQGKQRSQVYTGREDLQRGSLAPRGLVNNVAHQSRCGTETDEQNHQTCCSVFFTFSICQRAKLKYSCTGPRKRCVYFVLSCVNLHWSAVRERKAEEIAGMTLLLSWMNQCLGFEWTKTEKKKEAFAQSNMRYCYEITGPRNAPSVNESVF